MSFLWTLIAVSLLTSPALPQDLRPRPIENGVKHAGTYHLATGEWTRESASTALVGPQALYDNTCTAGYYQGIPSGTTAVDSGRIPNFFDGGIADIYTVNGFSTAYCSQTPGTTTLGISYYDCYAACDGLTAASPVASFSLANLPGGAPSGPRGAGW